MSLLSILNLRVSTYLKSTMMMMVFVCHQACFDDLNTTPTCFKEGQTRSTEATQFEINVCCEPGVEGDSFCASFFEMEGYAPIAALSYCTEQNTCHLCEIGENCACLNNRDCTDNPGEVCKVIDDTDLCKTNFGEDFADKRCAVCTSP